MSTLFFHLSPPLSLSQSFFSLTLSTFFYHYVVQREQKGTGPVGGVKMDSGKRRQKEDVASWTGERLHLKEELKSENMTPWGDKG